MEGRAQHRLGNSRHPLIHGIPGYRQRNHRSFAAFWRGVHSDRFSLGAHVGRICLGRRCHAPSSIPVWGGLLLWCSVQHLTPNTRSGLHGPVSTP